MFCNAGRWSGRYWKAPTAPVREVMSEQTRGACGRRITAPRCRAPFAPIAPSAAASLFFHKNGKLISIEGDPAFADFARASLPERLGQLRTADASERLTKIRYRRPARNAWEDLDLETAMDMVADRLWESRERTFREKQDGQIVMQTKAIAHLGGATLDNEENYLIKKLFTGGSGHGLRQQPGPDMT